MNQVAEGWRRRASLLAERRRRERLGKSGTWLPYFSIDYLRSAWTRLWVRRSRPGGEARPPFFPQSRQRSSLRRWAA